MKGRNDGARACVATTWLWFASAGLSSLLVCSCAETRPMPPRQPGENSIAAARAATKKKDWMAAASRWADLYWDGGPDAREACAQAGRALVKLEDVESARSLVESGLQQWPDAPELLEFHGDLLAQLGFRRAAEKDYLRALEVDPKRCSALLALARVRLELGLEDGARDALQRRIENGEGCADTYRLLAEASAGARDFATAYVAWERAFELRAPKADELVRAASLYTDEQVRKTVAVAADKSRAWLLRAAELDPQNTHAHYLLGVIAEHQNDLDSAIDCYRRAIETDPAFIPALASLATLYARRGEYDSAREFADRALRLEKDPERRDALERAIQPPVASSPLGAAHGGR